MYLVIRYIILFYIQFIICQNSAPILSAINVDGNIKIETEHIINSSGLVIDTELTANDINNAINRLWLLNRFADIQIEAEETKSGLVLYIEVDEFPLIKKIKFIGNTSKSSSKLLELSSLKEGDVLTSQKINKAINFLKNDYIDNHFHQSNISYDIIELQDHSYKDIHFNISKGEKSKIQDIQYFSNGKQIKPMSILQWVNENIVGNKNSQNQIFSNELNKHIGDVSKWRWYKFWKGKYNDEILENMKSELTNYFRSLGFLDFTVLDYQVVTKNNKTILSIDIEQGERFKINKIDFQGNHIYKDSLLLSSLLFNEKEIFDAEKFNLSNYFLGSMYSEKGFLFAEINPVLFPSAKDSLDIYYNINENNIVKIRQILIKGNEKTEENVIRREIEIFPGNIFNQTGVNSSYRNIFMLNFFENVIPDIRKINNQEVDLIFDITEKSAGQLNFSMGYNGQYGITGGGGFTFPNFLGKGQTVSFNYNRGLSSNNQNIYSDSSSDVAGYQSFSFSFIEPWVFDTPNLIGVSASYQQRGRSTINYYEFDEEKIAGAIRIGRKFKWPDKYFRGSWRLGGRQTTYSASSEDNLTDYFGPIEDYLQLENNKYIFKTSGIYVGQYISRDSRDHPEFPTMGSQFNWNFTLSGTFLGGDEDYFKNEFEFKLHNKLIDNLVLFQNFKVGVISPIEVVGERSIVPPSSRFYMGGTGIPYGEMLRGYSDNYVGPFGSTRPKGGNMMLKYSLELRYLFSEQPIMYVLLFADAGNVWNDYNIVDPFKLRRSLGFGIRAMMPMIGILGYDIGYGFDSSIEEHLSGNSSPHGWEYHFIFGLPIY